MDEKIHYKYRIGISDLESLYDLLSEKGYENVGSIYRDGAIMLEHLGAFNDLASGYYEALGKGKYDIKNKHDGSLFQYTLGPQSFKKYLSPPKRKLWSATKNEDGFRIETPDPPTKMAFWGIRSCELHALDILDTIFLKETYENAWYKQARTDLFVIAVGCTAPSANCFCTTTDTGPEPRAKFDLSLVEVLEYGTPYYLVSVGSEHGEEVVKKLEFQKAEPPEIAVGEDLLTQAANQMEVKFNPKEAAKILKENLEHSHWEDIAARCLSCANCTMVCPTCFCTTTEDITDIRGEHTERWLRWDSCFNGDFSFIHGGQIRNSTKSRYRQWLTHKLSNWYDQFGTSGCVGCGRCTTWCPVDIDITEELKALSKT